MIGLPPWFTRPARGKKAAEPPSSAELAALLTQADADVAEVERREAAASEREATERSEEAVSHFEDVQLEANRLRRLRDRLRADIEAAQAREAAERRAEELAAADATREAVCHAGLIAEATALAERRFDLHLQLAEVEREVTARERELSRRVTVARATYERHGVDRGVQDSSNLLANHVLLVDMIEVHVTTLAGDDPARRYFTDLIHRLAPNRNMYPRVATRAEA